MPGSAQTKGRDGFCRLFQTQNITIVPKQGSPQEWVRRLLCIMRVRVHCRMQGRTRMICQRSSQSAPSILYSRRRVQSQITPACRKQHTLQCMLWANAPYSAKNCAFAAKRADICRAASCPKSAN